MYAIYSQMLWISFQVSRSSYILSRLAYSLWNLSSSSLLFVCVAQLKNYACCYHTASVSVTMLISCVSHLCEFGVVIVGLDCYQFRICRMFIQMFANINHTNCQRFSCIVLACSRCVYSAMFQNTVTFFPQRNYVSHH